jgi:hypothetical protein
MVALKGPVETVTAFLRPRREYQKPAKIDTSPLKRLKLGILYVLRILVVTPQTLRVMSGLDGTRKTRRRTPNSILTRIWRMSGWSRRTIICRREQRRGGQAGGSFLLLIM